VLAAELEETVRDGAPEMTIGQCLRELIEGCRLVRAGNPQ
jgi:hypothetical protein